MCAGCHQLLLQSLSRCSLPGMSWINPRGAVRQFLHAEPRGSELLGGAGAWLQWQLCAARGLCSTALPAPTPRLLLRLSLFLWLKGSILPAPALATEV